MRAHVSDSGCKFDSVQLRDVLSAQELLFRFLSLLCLSECRLVSAKAAAAAVVQRHFPESKLAPSPVACGLICLPRHAHTHRVTTSFGSFNRGDSVSTWSSSGCCASGTAAEDASLLGLRLAVWQLDF